MRTQVDIILPCYNPGSQWVFELEKFYLSTKELFDVNFLIVNDGTIGQTVAAQVNSIQRKKIPVSLIAYNLNKGKGFALRKGVQHSKAPYIVYTDVDFPFTDQSMIAILKELTTNQFDVVVGFRDEHYYQKKMSWFRKTLSKSFRFFIRRFLNMTITDTQCGLKGFNNIGKEKFLQTKINRYLFDFEFIYAISNNSNIKVKAIEVQLKENVIFTKMRLKILLQEILNLIKILLKSKRTISENY